MFLLDSHTHTQAHSSCLTHPTTHQGLKADIIILLRVCVCVFDFSLWLLVCIFSVTPPSPAPSPPIIPDERAPALLPHRGPVAPQWRGHGDHLLPANCPAAPQDAGEPATSRHNLAGTPLGYILGSFLFFSFSYCNEE